MASVANLITHQPFKGAFVLGSLLFNLSRLPLWILKAALAPQHPSYSFRQALSVRIVRAFLYTSSLIRVRTPLPLTPSNEGSQFVLLKADPKDANKFKGPMLAAPQTVHPADLGAIWYPSPPSSSTPPESLLVILHIHGGAYVIGDGRKDYMGPFATALATRTPATHVLAPSYRLSSLPPSATSNPFPAALQDALTSYLYLLHDVGVPASRIVLSGDSAGANCAIGLLRYISDFGSQTDIPQPAAALLWSPWINPTFIPPTFESSTPGASSDYIPTCFVAWGAAALAAQNLPLTGPTGLKGNPYVDVGSAGFKTPVPVWVSLGGAEALYGEGMDWVKVMRGEGCEVEVDVEEGACHDVLLVAGMLGMEGEKGKIVGRGGGWLGKVVR